MFKLISGLTPLTGSFGGGTLLTITGTGLDTETKPTVTVCSAECGVESVTDSEIQCRAPANSGSGTEDCSVSVSQASGKSVDLADSPGDVSVSSARRDRRRDQHHHHRVWLRRHREQGDD